MSSAGEVQGATQGSVFAQRVTRRDLMARRFLIATAVMALLAVFAVPAASADTTDIIQPQNETSDQGFQAGTCVEEQETGKNCSVETPAIFFKTAGGHPPIGFTQYIIEHEPFTPLPSPPFPAGSLQAEIPGEDINDHTIKTLRVDLPPGLTVNPEATPRCPISDFLAGAPGAMVPTCDEATKVGKEKITLVTNKPGVEVAPGVVIPIKGFVIPPTPELTDVDDLQPRAERRRTGEIRFHRQRKRFRSSSKPKLPGRATSTRASRSNCPTRQKRPGSRP